jgi:transcriptional regulator NrdR family protein
MATKRRGYLIVTVGEVACPYCGNAQVNPLDESYQWEVGREWPRTLTCQDCDKVFSTPDKLFSKGHA